MIKKVELTLKEVANYINCPNHKTLQWLIRLRPKKDIRNSYLPPIYEVEKDWCKRVFDHIDLTILHCIYSLRHHDSNMLMDLGKLLKNRKDDLDNLFNFQHYAFVKMSINGNRIVGLFIGAVDTSIPLIEQNEYYISLYLKSFAKLDVFS